MHFFYLANRCFVLLFTLTVVSSISHEICSKLRNQQEKIRVLGEAYDGQTLIIMTTSGQLFKLNLNSTICRQSSQGHYYLNISQEPTSHVSKEWPNAKLNLSENRNKLYALQFVQNLSIALNSSILRSMFNTIHGSWYDILPRENCTPWLVMGQSTNQLQENKFESCNAKTIDENEYAFMVSRECTEFSEENGPITFVRTGREYSISVDSSYRFTPNNNDTVLSASYLTAPYNILLFIYSSGQVEIRQVDAFPSDQDKAPEPDWTITISDFIQCGGNVTLPMSTVPPSNTLRNVCFLIMATVFVIGILFLCLRERISTISPRTKKRKKKKRKKRIRKKKKSKKKNKTKMNNKKKAASNPFSILRSSNGNDTPPSGSPTTRPSSSIFTDNLRQSSTGLEYSTAKGSSLKGSAILKKSSPSSNLESTPSPALGSNESPLLNVNSKASEKLTSAAKPQSPRGSLIVSNLISKTKRSSTLKGSSNVKCQSNAPAKVSSEAKEDKDNLPPKKSPPPLVSDVDDTTRTSPPPNQVKAKRTLAKKKQTIGKWIAGLLWKKNKKKKKKRGDKNKPKEDTKKDNEKK